MHHNPEMMMNELENQSVSNLRKYLVTLALDNPMELDIDDYLVFKSTDDALSTIECETAGQITEELRKLIKQEAYMDYEARQTLLEILNSWDKYHLTNLKNNDELVQNLANQMDKAKEYFSESTHDLAEKLLN